MPPDPVVVVWEGRQGGDGSRDKVEESRLANPGEDPSALATKFLPPPRVEDTPLGSVRMLPSYPPTSEETSTRLE